MMRTASQIEASGSTEITGDVIASLAFMAGSIPVARQGSLHLPSVFDLHQATPGRAYRRAPQLKSALILMFFIATANDWMTTVSSFIARPVLRLSAPLSHPRERSRPP